MTRKTSQILIGVIVIALIAAGVLYQFAGDDATDAVIPESAASIPEAATPTKAAVANDVRATPVDDKRPTILVVGDSLSAGYGLADLSDGWVALLQQRLDENDLGYRVVNASISGDTSNGGAARLPAALATHKPDLVVIELGGNDGLRGFPIETMRRNFERMITASQAAGADVMLLGMMIPPNYGERYTTAFVEQYEALADDYDLALVSFFLEGVALDDSLMQSDGIHPNAEAQPVMLENVWPTLVNVLSPADY